jgi:hypothetical protein
MQKCYTAEQPITHIVGYTKLAPCEYTDRHNQVSGYSNWTVCKHMELQMTDKYCEHRHIHKNGYNVNSTTIMLDVPVITDWTILANLPDVVLHDKTKKTSLLTYTVIPDDSNINTKETEKLSKYKDLQIKVSRMWAVRTKIVPVIIGALRTITKGLNQNIQ